MRVSVRAVMDAERFWALADRHLAGAEDTPDGGEEAVERLVAALTRLPKSEIEDFQALLDDAVDRAYRWDLWDAAYAISGGCSDDGFEYFRAWLVGRGRAAYEAALRDPDSLHEHVRDDEDWLPELESLLYAGARAYEEATGDELPARRRECPAEPAGERFDEETAGARFPRLFARLAQRGV